MAATGTSGTIAGLNNGTLYYVVVTATNTVGEGQPSAQVRVTPSAATTPPSPPSIQRAVAGNAQVTLAWTTVGGATAYNLYYSESSFAEVTNLSADGITKLENATSPRILTGLDNFTTYYFVVTAENRAGESAASAEVSAVPLLPDGSVFSDSVSASVQGPDMVVLPTGFFRMGSPADELGRFNDEGPQRTVTLGKRIAMSRYEVTFADYDRFADADAGRSRPADQRWGRGTRPVINVDRADAEAYATWLSTQTGATYRLPTEAEWEYAARAGTTTRYYFGFTIGCNQANIANSTVATSRLSNACNLAGNSALDRTQPVGTYLSNAFGLFDMHGNVEEWVADCYQPNYSGAPVDGSARTSCENGGLIEAIVRGGSYVSYARARSAARGRTPQVTSSAVRGFRVVRVLIP